MLCSGRRPEQQTSSIVLVREGGQEAGQSWIVAAEASHEEPFQRVRQAGGVLPGNRSQGNCGGAQSAHASERVLTMRAPARQVRRRVAENGARTKAAGVPIAAARRQQELPDPNVKTENPPLGIREVHQRRIEPTLATKKALTIRAPNRRGET